jgi:Tfp pilus assembly protein PilF
MKLDFETNATIEETDFAVADLAEPATAVNSQKFEAGVRAARAGSRAEARLLLLEVVETDPDNEDAWTYLASVSEYPEEMLVFLKNVLRINPANESALERVAATEKMLAANFAERGERAARAGQKQFALQCFKQALALDAQNETAWLGTAETVESDEEKTEIYERVLSFNP